VLSERDRFEGIINVKIRVGLRLDPFLKESAPGRRRKGVLGPSPVSEFEEREWLGEAPA
jgi:hypothetical protein